MRLFEVTGLADPGLATFEDFTVWDENKDEPSPAYDLPTLSDYAVADDGSEELRELLRVCSLDDLGKEVLASRALIDRQRELYRDLLKISQAAGDVAGLRRKYHGTSSEMLWDLLQLVSQTDLLVREAREAKMEEYLTQSFKATLKASGITLCFFFMGKNYNNFVQCKTPRQGEAGTPRMPSCTPSWMLWSLMHQRPTGRLV